MSCLIRLSQNHMNTTFHLEIACEPSESYRAQETLRRGHERLTRIESEISEFLPRSPVYRINHSIPHTRIEVSESFLEIWKVCEQAMSVSRKTFNCFVKSASSEPRLHVDATNRNVARGDTGTHIGFGAVGKGFALDKIRELIVQDGFENYCLNAGGSSIAVSGTRGADPWQIMWSWVPGSGLPLNHTGKTPVAIAISGNQTQPDHLIDPRSRASSRAIASAFVGHPSAAMSDALSTALFITGFDLSLDYFKDLVEPPAVAIIDANHTPRWNGVFQNLWGTLCGLLIPAITFAEGVTGGIKNGGVPNSVADEIIDFSDVVTFAPYITEKNRLWILLPALALVWVYWHLQKECKKPARTFGPQIPLDPTEKQLEKEMRNS